MKKAKTKEKLFERVEITDQEFAQQTYEKEQKKFKFKLICTVISLFSTVGCFLWKVDLGAFLNELIAFVTVAGWVATLISSPLNVLKTIVKFAKIGWCIVPFYFIDLIGAALGAVLALYIFYAFPVVFCIVSLFQSYLNKKDAEEYLEMGDDISDDLTDVIA